MNLIQDLIDSIEEAQLWGPVNSLNRNDYLKVAGTCDSNFYYLIEGSVRIFILDENEEHTIRFGYKNSLISALDSFLTGTSSPLFIQALKKTVYKSVRKEDFSNLMQHDKHHKELWKNVLESFAIQQMEREIDLLTSSSEERLSRVLKRSPHLFQEIPHKYIASYLRMSPETLSRIKKS